MESLRVSKISSQLSSSPPVEIPLEIPSSPLPFPVPVEIHLEIVSYLSLKKQAQFKQVSRGARDIINVGVSFLEPKPKFGDVFNSLKKLELFFDEAEQYTKRSRRTLIVLLEELLSGYPDGEFEHILRKAGILPYDLSLTIIQRHWLKLLPNLLGVLRWVSAEGMHAIIDCPFPLAERLKNALLALSHRGESAALSLAMLKDDRGIALGITENFFYLHYVARFDTRKPLTPQQILNLDLGIEIATILLERGVDIERRNRCEETALHPASRRGYSKLVEFLISKGANIEARDVLGQTPLRIAAETGEVEVVKCLLKAGANPNIPPPPYRFDPHITDTALDTARRHRHVEIIALLEEAGGLSRKDLDTEKATQALFKNLLLIG